MKITDLDTVLSIAPPLPLGRLDGSPPRAVAIVGAELRALERTP